MIPPTSIDGTDVTEITVDGQTVFSASIPKPPSGISRYPVEAGSGSTLVDVWGGHDATINGATWTTNNVPKGNFSLDYDGLNDFSSAGIINAYDGLSGLSVSARVNVDSIPSGSEFFVKQGVLVAEAGNSRDTFGLTLEGGDGFGFYVEGTSGAERLTEENAGLSTQTNFHLVGTYDSNGDMALYLDGSKIKTKNAPGGQTISTNNPFEIGARTSISAFTDGRIDEVRTYSKKLSDQEVSNLFNNDRI
jgi:hypothetical protein